MSQEPKRLAERYAVSIPEPFYSPDDRQGRPEIQEFPADPGESSFSGTLEAATEWTLPVVDSSRGDDERDRRSGLLIAALPWAAVLGRLGDRPWWRSFVRV
jgi:hypothetical protein